MITRNLLSCCMYSSAIGGATNGGGVINLAYNRLFPQSYGIRSDMTSATNTGVSVNAMRLYLTKTGKALEDLTEQEIYNPNTALEAYVPHGITSQVKSVKSNGSSLNDTLEYTFVIQNSSSTDEWANIDTIYVCSANTTSSSLSNANLYVLSIHKLNQPITLAPLDTYQFKVSYSNLVIDVPSTIAST